MAHPLTGTKQSPEHIRKRTEARIRNGNTQRSEETRLKISNALKGKLPSEETRSKLREYHKSHPVKYWLGKKKPPPSPETRRRLGAAHRGSKCNFWRGGVVSENHKLRDSLDYKMWREAVFARDNWTCQRCGVRGGKIHAHHIKAFADYPELRFDVANGETLCLGCHRKEHKTSGMTPGRPTRRALPKGQLAFDLASAFEVNQ